MLNRLIPMSELVAAPFNNMQTLKFKAQLTNVFFATVNQMLKGSSQLPTSAKCMVIESLSTVQTCKETVCGRSQKLGGATEHLIDCSEKCICWLRFVF